MERIEVDIPQIVKLYTEQKLGCIKIGREMGVSSTTIKERLREAGVRIRHLQETYSLRGKTKATGTIEQPQVGDIRPGRQLGLASKTKYNIWLPCSICGKPRWVELKKGEPLFSRCFACLSKIPHAKGKLSSNWKGGKHKQHGYVFVYLEPSDFFYSMTDSKGYVREHRLIMAKYLGRNLHRWEIVHHKNKRRDDNRIENLQLVSDERHNQITILENRIRYLEKRVTLLEAENILLKQGTLESQRITGDVYQGGINEQ